jgi:hypothetical protein
MASNEFMRETLEHFKQQRLDKLEEIRQMESTIRQLERALGENQTEFDARPQILAASEQNGISSSSSSTAQRKANIQGDEFFGLSQPEAARRYLKKIGQAVSVDEILEALRRGGCKVGGADPKKVLYICMVRDTRNFIKLPNGMIGLRDFYADRNLNKFTADRKAKLPKRKRGRPRKNEAAEKEQEKSA